MINKVVFTLSELAEARKRLILDRSGILPIEVHEDGYYYDPHELFRTMTKKDKKSKKNARSNKR